MMMPPQFCWVTIVLFAIRYGAQAHISGNLYSVSLVSVYQVVLHSGIWTAKVNPLIFRSVRDTRTQREPAVSVDDIAVYHAIRGVLVGVDSVVPDAGTHGGITPVVMDDVPRYRRVLSVYRDSFTRKVSHLKALDLYVVGGDVDSYLYRVIPIDDRPARAGRHEQDRVARGPSSAEKKTEHPLRLIILIVNAFRRDYGISGVYQTGRFRQGFERRGKGPNIAVIAGR